MGTEASRTRSGTFPARDLPERLQHALGSRYVLERELGHGGMATVFLAHDLRILREMGLAEGR